MPAEMARAVRLHHTPNKMKPIAWQPRDSHEKEDVFEVQEEPEFVSDTSLARRRSAAARAILDEADKMGSSQTAYNM